MAFLAWHVISGRTASDRAHEFAHDASRFRTPGSAVKALDAIRLEAVEQRTACIQDRGRAPVCQAWASVAAYVTIAATQTFDCPPAGRELMRQRVAAYIDAVRALPGSATRVPDPPRGLTCR